MFHRQIELCQHQIEELREDYWKLYNESQTLVRCLTLMQKLNLNLEHVTQVTACFGYDPDIAD